MSDRSIRTLTGREILDSRGNPTIEAEITLADGTVGRGTAPSGASTGSGEAVELRDGEQARYGGKGVQRAAQHIRAVLAPAVAGLDAADLWAVDGAMRAADGTPDCARLGANGMLAVSIAACRAAAASLGIPVFRLLGGERACCLPVPMMNVLNGGAHASNSLDSQEFLILPVGAASFREGLRWCSEVFHALAGLLRSRGLPTAVGDEGGFAPDLDSDEEALELLLAGIQRAGYRPGRDFVLGMDAAASEWRDPVQGSGFYRLPKSGRVYTTDQLIAHWQSLAGRYPLASLEDGLDEEDWPGWQKLTAALGERVQLVGDDLFVTNTQRIGQGIRHKAANAVLIKPNQIGTVSRTLAAVRLAQQSGWRAIASNRSGETEDVFLADLAVGLNTGQIKTGAPCRSERVAKYNQLLRIEQALGPAACYPGSSALARCNDRPL